MDRQLQSCPPSNSPSIFVRFMNSFLQERNINWVLAVGVMVLLGSSLMLVTTVWDQCEHLWQDLIILAYSAAIYGAGQWTYHHLGLRRTGSVLQALTVLMIPILFLVIRWTPTQSPDDVFGWLAMFVLTSVFGAFAARRIFAFALHSTQPTFLACYLILSMAGAVLPLVDTSWAPGIAALLWATFALGAIKVSRHIFWLTEERRTPRIFGFFPIALLAGQFLFLIAAHAALHLDLQWIGFGCVLVAIPVLGTADAVAHVFEQRTGNLVRPLPWAVVLPIIVGLILCAAGIVLSAVSIVPPARPYALVVTSAVAAGLMAQTARRTGKQAFVWAMLFGLMLAYNFSPGFFMELVRAVLDRGASMVKEQRLPFAFYGTTYLPFLAILIIAGRWASKSGSELFARPIKHFVFGLTSLLWALSLTHEKAMFPVGLCLVGIAIAQLVALRSWLGLMPAVLAWISAAIGLPVFAEKLLGVPWIAGREVECVAVAAGMLLLAGRWFDASIVKLMPEGLARFAPNPCLMASVALSFVVTTIALLTLNAPINVAGFLSLLVLAAAARSYKSREFRVPLSILLNLHILSATVTLTCPSAEWATLLRPESFSLVGLPLAAVAAGSLVVWAAKPINRHEIEWLAGLAMRIGLHGLVATGLANSLDLADLTAIDIACAIAAFLLTAISEWIVAYRSQHEEWVWIGFAVLGAGVAYLWYVGVISLHYGFGMFIVLGVGVLLGLIRNVIDPTSRESVFARPLRLASLTMPMAAVVLGTARHLLGGEIAWLGANSLALLLAAAFYFWRGIEESRKAYHVLAAVILNLALILLWRELDWSDPQFFMVPIGISVLALVELLKNEIGESFHNPLRYAGALVILVSPTFHIVGGSWVHLLTLMVASVAIALLAIGLRVRALLYTGTAFLVADLAAMLVRGSIDNSNILWIAGLTLGAGILALGAYCEKHRELLQLRMQILASTLQSWN